MGKRRRSQKRRQKHVLNDIMKEITELYVGDLHYVLIAPDDEVMYEMLTLLLLCCVVLLLFCVVVG